MKIYLDKNYYYFIQSWILNCLESKVKLPLNTHTLGYGFGSPSFGESEKIEKCGFVNISMHALLSVQDQTNRFTFFVKIKFELFLIITFMFLLINFV